MGWDRLEDPNLLLHYSPECVEGGFSKGQLALVGCWPETGKNAR